MTSAKETMTSLQSRANNAASAGEKKRPQSIMQWVQVMKPQIAKALPSVITPERFTRIAMTAVSSNPKLAECTPQSFCGALMQAAQLGLEPNTPLGQAYLIPYRNHGTMEASFQIGYQGLIALAHRSGEFKNITAHEVCQNDECEYEYGLEPKLTHKPALQDRGPVIAYYAVYTLTNGGYEFLVMSKEDVEKHARRFSKSFNNGPWQTNFDEMAKKTAIKALLKYAPISTEFARKTVSDEATINAVPGDNGMELRQEDFVDVAEVDVKVTDTSDEAEINPETGEVK